jgi:hypothetical protein
MADLSLDVRDDCPPARARPAFLPKAEQGAFVAAHDDPGVRAADEGAAVLVVCCAHDWFHYLLRR